MQGEIKFRGIIELEADDGYIAQRLIGNILSELNIQIYTMCGAIRIKAGSLKLKYLKLG